MHIIFNVVCDLIKPAPVLNFYYHNIIIQWLYSMWLIKVVMKSWNEIKIKILIKFF